MLLNDEWTVLNKDSGYFAKIKYFKLLSHHSVVNSNNLEDRIRTTFSSLLIPMCSCDDSYIDFKKNMFLLNEIVYTKMVAVEDLILILDSIYTTLKIEFKRHNATAYNAVIDLLADMYNITYDSRRLNFEQPNNNS